LPAWRCGFDALIAATSRQADERRSPSAEKPSVLPEGLAALITNHSMIAISPMKAG
jgi:hypothetical protein